MSCRSSTTTWSGSILLDKCSTSRLYFGCSDAVVNDEMWKTTLKLGKPAGVKLVIKDIENSVKALNSGVTDKYKLLIVVQTIHDAYRLVQEVPAIKSINLGGAKNKTDIGKLAKLYL